MQHLITNPLFIELLQELVCICSPLPVKSTDNLLAVDGVALDCIDQQRRVLRLVMHASKAIEKDHLRVRIHTTNVKRVLNLLMERSASNIH